MILKELLALREAVEKKTVVMKLNEAKKPKKSAMTDDELDAKYEAEALAALKKLKQPVGISGGAYTYWVDVTETPLQFIASDGSEVTKAKTLRDIGGWLDDAEDWYAFLNGEEDLKFLMDNGIVRLKKGRTDQQDHEANMRG